MAANPYQVYQQNNVTTASPGELTLMLYNGCLKFIKHARLGIETKNIEMKNTNLNKAQAIIRELMITLDRSMPISESFLPLYDFINLQLIDANVKNDLNALAEAESLVTEFRDTWKEVIKMNRVKQHAVGGQA